MQLSIDDKRILMRIFKKNKAETIIEGNLLKKLANELQNEIYSDQALFMYPKKLLVCLPDLQLKAA